MDECPLYADPALYDRMFPAAASAASMLDDTRRARLQASESFYLEEAESVRGKVLELGCGSGRLTIPLAQAGIDVVGIDLSETMLGAARAKANRMGVSIQFVQADMRTFALPTKFSAIFIPGNSLLHLLSPEEFGQCLRRAGQHLAEGGRLVFDVSNPDLARLTRDPSRRYPVMSWKDPERGVVQLEEMTAYDQVSQIWEISWYFSTSAERDFRAIDYRLRMLFPEELLEALRATGFRLLARYGEFPRQPFVAGSPRQVCICILA